LRQIQPERTLGPFDHQQPSGHPDPGLSTALSLGALKRPWDLKRFEGEMQKSIKCGKTKWPDRPFFFCISPQAPPSPVTPTAWWHGSTTLGSTNRSQGPAFRIDKKGP